MISRFASGARSGGLLRCAGALFSAALVLGVQSADAQTPTPAEGTGTSTSAVSPEAEAKAVEHFKAAKEHYAAGKYVEALLEFQKAHKLKPTAAITYNVARCYEQLSQWEEAIAAYERYIKETSDVRERTQALDKIEFLKSKVSLDTSSPEARYKAKIDTGKKAFSRGDYEAAIQEFKGAYDIKPSAGVLFNIAKSFERMARYEEAIDHFQQYLDLDPNAQDRPDVEETIRRLKKSIRERFQELAVSSEPPGADIYLDDRNTGLQGQTNYRFKVTPGPHVLFIDLNGYEAVKRDFVMPDDKPLALEFSLKKLENVGFTTITLNVEGARIFIDGAIIGLSPYKQQKALEQGKHQITIEAAGRPRYTQDFTIERDKTNALNIVLEDYDAPVKDETLSKWGNNLLLIGVIAGTLGFVGPFAYQQLVLRRDLPEAIGPERVVWGEGVNPDDAVFWGAATAASKRDNAEADTLSGIQVGSVIGGVIVASAGLGLYIWKWVRDEPTAQVITAGLDSEPDGAPVVGLSGFNIAAGPEGGSLGILGNF